MSFSIITVLVVTSKLKDSILKLLNFTFLEMDELTKVIKSELIFIVSAWAIITHFCATLSRVFVLRLDNARSVVNDIDASTFGVGVKVKLGVGDKVSPKVKLGVGDKVTPKVKLGVGDKVKLGVGDKVKLGIGLNVGDKVILGLILGLILGVENDKLLE